ncbi:hypothetical protein ACFLSU_06635 [Bacteroidota bacterium]
MKLIISHIKTNKKPNIFKGINALFIGNYKYKNQKTLKHLKVVSILVLIYNLSISCTPVSDTDFPFDNISEEIDFTLNNNEEYLSSRIQYLNKQANIEPFARTGLASKDEKTRAAKEIYYWEHIADILPLTINNNTLGISHISLTNNKAYISYKDEGDNKYGAVEIINLNNINYPTITSRATFPSSDINSVLSGSSKQTTNRKVWLAMSDKNYGAQLFEIDEQENMLTYFYRNVNLSDAIRTGLTDSANGIVDTHSYLYVTSGNKYGGTLKIKKTNLRTEDYETYQDAKYIASNGNSLIASLPARRDGILKVNRVSEGLNATNYEIGEIFSQDNKDHYSQSIMEFSPKNNNHLYVAKGKEGVSLIDVTNGSTINKSEKNMLTNGSTNGITTDDDYVYSANGIDGVSIAPHPTSSNEEISPVFHWDLDKQNGAANYIVAEGEWVFVAKTNGEIKILRKKIK